MQGKVSASWRVAQAYDEWEESSNLKERGGDKSSLHRTPTMEESWTIPKNVMATSWLVSTN